MLRARATQARRSKQHAREPPPDAARSNQAVPHAATPAFAHVVERDEQGERRRGRTQQRGADQASDRPLVDCIN
jgi:hypothetical protein